MDVVVVGGGVAGLACGMYAARLGCDVVLIEEMALGGQLLNVAQVEAVPGVSSSTAGWDFATDLAEQAQDAGLKVVLDTATKVSRFEDRWRVIGSEFDAQAPVVVMATGSIEPKSTIEGAEHFFGRGVSHCAACDGPIFTGKRVLMVGGGNIALWGANQLARIAENVTLVLPRDDVPVWTSLRASFEGFENQTVVVGEALEVLGDSVVTGVVVRDQDGRERHFDVSAVFLADERAPNGALIEGIAQQEPSEAVKVDARCETSESGLLAIGDLRAGSPGLVSAALGDGAVAARRAMELAGRLVS
jgi:thioredoxin reductase (NADPH)